MRWRVGIFYRIPDILILVSEQKIARKDLFGSFPDHFHNVDLTNVVDISLKAGWLEIDAHDYLKLTLGGEEIIKISEQTIQLRYIISTLLRVFQPRWAVFAVQGRAAVKEYAPLEAVQCLEEAGYFDSMEDDIVRWWDKLAASYRKEREKENLEIGRLGERKSFEYEKMRTGKNPDWRSLEYSGLGYDLISQLNIADTRRLLIEVKASNERWDKARFYLTKNEWTVLSDAEYAVIHLWSLHEYPSSPSIVPIRSLSMHIPKEIGEAEWQTITCPFSAFPRPQEQESI